jgi:hypothetical protein
MICQKLNKLIKYLIIVFLITLAILSYTYKFGNCDKCSFEINDTKINSKEFMEIYQPICLKAENRYINTSVNIIP